MACLPASQKVSSLVLRKTRGSGQSVSKELVEFNLQSPADGNRLITLGPLCTIHSRCAANVSDLIAERVASCRVQSRFRDLGAPDSSGATSGASQTPPVSSFCNKGRAAPGIPVARHARRPSYAKSIDRMSYARPEREMSLLATSIRRDAFERSSSLQSRVHELPTQQRH